MKVVYDRVRQKSKKEMVKLVELDRGRFCREWSPLWGICILLQIHAYVSIEICKYIKRDMHICKQITHLSPTRHLGSMLRSTNIRTIWDMKEYFEVVGAIFDISGAAQHIDGKINKSKHVISMNMTNVYCKIGFYEYDWCVLQNRNMHTSKHKTAQYFKDKYTILKQICISVKINMHINT